jgi:hypothetical protein
MMQFNSFKKLCNPRTWFAGDIVPAERMALGMGIALLLLSILTAWRGHPFRAEKTSIAAAVMAAFGILYPRALLPLEKFLRNSVFFFAWLNTKLMLLLVYYLVFTPAAIMLKIYGKKLLNRDFRKEVESYFEPKDEDDYRPEQDELQY